MYRYVIFIYPMFVERRKKRVEIDETETEIDTRTGTGTETNGCCSYRIH